MQTDLHEVIQPAVCSEIFWKEAELKDPGQIVAERWTLVTSSSCGTGDLVSLEEVIFTSA